MPDEPEGNEPTGKTFTQEEFDKALQRERDKLYGRLEKADAKISEYDDRFKAMTGQVEELEKDRQKREKEEAKRQKEVADAAKKAEEAEMNATQLLARRQEEWEAKQAEREQQWQSQFSGLQEQLAQRDAILEKEREFGELRAYAQEAVAAAREEIAPELIDLIGGNTREEIDASIVLMKTKSQQILAAVQGQQVAQRAAMPGVSPAGFTPTGPIDAQGGTRTFTPEEIQAMSTAEYARHRDAFGVTGNNIGSGRFPHLGKGLYG